MKESAKPPSTSPKRGKLSIKVPQVPLTISFSRWLKQLLKFQVESTAELVAQIEQLHQAGGVSHDTLAMLNGALSISQMQVGDIMVPKLNMNCIHVDTHLTDIIELISGTLHSRYPVIDEQEQPVGLLFSKDIFTNNRFKQADRLSNLTARVLMRPAETVPENMNLAVLLRRFRSGKNHLAIALNEFGEMVGLITIEDVLEQIVGTIRDEHDADEPIWILDHEGHSTVKAVTPIEAFNRHFGTQFDSVAGDTIASVITSHFEKLPKQVESFELDNLLLKVLKADSRRLHLLSIKRRQSGEVPSLNDQVLVS